jgi:putative transposase
MSTRSARVYRGLEELTYPFHDATFTVTQCGRICFKARKVNLSHVFAGQNVGVTQVGDRIWLVTFMRYDLGYFDDETCRLEPIENPFGPKVTYVLGMNCHPCDRNRPDGIGSSDACTGEQIGHRLPLAFKARSISQRTCIDVESLAHQTHTDVTVAKFASGAHCNLDLPERLKDCRVVTASQERRPDALHDGWMKQLTWEQVRVTIGIDVRSRAHLFAASTDDKVF